MIQFGVSYQVIELDDIIDMSIRRTGTTAVTNGCMKLSYSDTVVTVWSFPTIFGFVSFFTQVDPIYKSANPMSGAGMCILSLVTTDMRIWAWLALQVPGAKMVTGHLQI